MGYTSDVTQQRAVVKNFGGASVVDLENFSNFLQR